MASGGDRATLPEARMKIAFACPTCGHSYEADAAHANRKARCKGCGGVVTVPSESVPPATYGLAEPQPKARPTARRASRSGDENAFVEAPPNPNSVPVPKRLKPKKVIRKAQREAASFAGRVAPAWRWLLGIPTLAVVILGAIAALAPNGTLIAGAILAAVGMLCVLVGFGVGAYGALHEDFIYFVLYLVFPLYTGYFIVANWDSMWRWFLLMVLGAGLVTIAGSIVLPKLESMPKAKPEAVARLVLTTDLPGLGRAFPSVTIAGA